MRVSVVFPPSICLPNQMYFSLPILAGALVRAGHEPRICELNLAAADMLLTPERTDRYLTLARRRAGSRAESTDSAALGAMLDAMEPKLRRGPDAKAALRDSVRFFEKAAFRDSFWNVVDCLGFYYQLNPIISPHRDAFADDMIEHQRADAWTPLEDLYQEGLLDEVLSGSPGLIGISLAFPEQAAEALRLARRIRDRRSGAHVCIGGPLVTQHAAKWLADGFLLDYCDSVCVGDGETTIVELADALEGSGGLDAVTNLVWRDTHGVVQRNTPEPHLESMDELPVPDFDSFDMRRFFTPRPIYPLMTSRGCYWGRCTFCSIGWRENFRQAGPAKIKADVTDLARRYGARYVQLQDSSIPPRGALHLARAIREEGLETYWVSGMKFERVLLDPAYARELAAGGCRSLLLGFESANQQVLDRMDKGYDLEDTPAMLENLRSAGISAELLWFIGFPRETRGEALRTIRWLYERKHLFGLAAFVSEYLLHPDTIVFDRPKEFGVTIKSVINDQCDYEVDAGMGLEDLRFIKRALGSTNNRTLVCNSSHLPHLVEGGLDLRGLERQLVVPPEVVAYCEAGTRSIESEGS
jgi:anaerobic magnesium-protoporphyrin IX monomethyl ester cyclase